MKTITPEQIKTIQTFCSGKFKSREERLEAIGGVNKIVPKEGIVFVYKGNTLKFTGVFAPINQILGLFY